MRRSLPLTTMEEFLFWEDRPAYPWSCFARLHFSGRLDQATLEAALERVLPRHPMLTAKVDLSGQRPRWVFVENPMPLTTWEAGPFRAELPSATHLDIRREIGVRFHVRLGESDSDLTIQFHHCCCDGAGMLLFIRELLVAYAMAYGATPRRTRLAKLDPNRLEGRGRYGLTPWKLLRMAPKQAVGLLGARQFLMRHPVPVVPHRPQADDSPLPSCYPATLHHLFDAETTTRLRQVAFRRGVSLNDLLARDLFLALHQWRTRQNVGDDAQWLRMMIPMNLRTAEDRLLPAALVVSSVFLDRRAPDFADPDRLLQGIHDEMDLIKRLRLGLTFIFSTALCRLLPGGLKRRVREDKCTISCIFTNVGTPFAHVPLPRSDHRLVAGNVTFEDMDVVAPVRPYLCTTVGAALYARRLGITLHYDPRPISAEGASDLMETYVGRIRTSAGD